MSKQQWITCVIVRLQKVPGKDLKRSCRFEVQLPNEICGDLDSLEQDIATQFSQAGVRISRDPDQYATDFTKCLRRIREEAPNILQDPWSAFPLSASQKSEGRMDVVVMGSLEGRVDQAFSVLHHLYMASGDPSLVQGEVCLITDVSVSMLLNKGVNTIHVPRSEGLLEENVGIIPLGRPAVISTQGLEWDVKDWKTEFGGQVSTSNHIRADVIVVETDEVVLFTVEIAKSVTDDNGGRDVNRYKWSKVVYEKAQRRKNTNSSN